MNPPPPTNEEALGASRNSNFGTKSHEFSNFRVDRPYKKNAKGFNGCRLPLGHYGISTPHVAATSNSPWQKDWAHFWICHIDGHHVEISGRILVEMGDSKKKSKMPLKCLWCNENSSNRCVFYPLVASFCMVNEEPARRWALAAEDQMNAGPKLLSKWLGERALAFSFSSCSNGSSIHRLLG